MHQKLEILYLILILSDSYNDGRGANLNAKIVYYQQTVRGSNAAK